MILSGAGRDFKKKQEKTKNKINYFVFIIIIDPHVATTMQISKREVRNPDFLLSLLSIGSFRFKKISKKFLKGKRNLQKKKILYVKRFEI